MRAYASTDRCIYRWPTPQARKWVHDFLDRARQDLNILAVVAIGSAVRKGVESEDLDIIVVCTSARTLRERAPMEVDLRAFDAPNVDVQIEAGHDLLGWAVIFGRPLFDRRGTWRRIAKRWSERVPLPSAEVARTRAAHTLKRMREMREMGDDEAAMELEVSYLTHRARGVLSEAGVYAASRPELPDQLRTVGARRLADKVADALEARALLRREMVG